MVKEFNSLEEIQKYYEKGNNAYIFTENGDYIDLVVLNFNLNVGANIEAWDIKAWNINCLNINADNINAYYINARDITASNIKTYNLNAWHINCLDINAWNIDACDISYWAVCFAYNSIKCKSITSKRENHKHFVLDGVLEVEENDE